MANVAHSTLTGSNLHENKGVSSATDNTVATASSGATVWQKLTASHLTGTGNAFGAQLWHLQYQETSGTSSDSLTGSTWNKVLLATELTNEITSSTLSSGVLSLPAGTYYAELSASATASSATRHRLRLRNTTDGSTLFQGLNFRGLTINTGSVTAGTIIGTAAGRFTLSGTKNIEMQLYASGTANYGESHTTGEAEVFADCKIWKVA